MPTERAPLRAAWATGLLATLLVAGCGGADDNLVDPDADQVLVTDALLTVDDLPDGFTEEPVDDENVTRCTEDVIGVSPREIDRAQTADETVQFQSGTISIRAQITAFESNDLPREILDGYDDDDYLDCLVDELRESADGAVVTDRGTDDLPVDDDAIDAGLTVTFSLELAGLAIEVRTYLALVGRYGIILDMTALSDELDEDLAEELFADMVARVADG